MSPCKFCNAEENGTQNNSCFRFLPDSIQFFRGNTIKHGHLRTKCRGKRSDQKNEKINLATVMDNLSVLYKLEL